MNATSAEKDATFKMVEAAYERSYEILRSAGNLPYLSTRAGMWAVSDSLEVYKAFCHFRIGQYHHVADLGSGDGKVVLIASIFTQATGYEINEALYNNSLEIRRELNLTNAKFLQEDFLRADLSPYDLLYVYPDKPLYALEKKLLSGWRGRLLVNGPHFPGRHFRKMAESPRGIGRFVLYEFS